MGLFEFLAGPLGWILKLVYGWCQNYFVAIFLFTLLMRLLMFPLSLQSQKKQADRIRLSPRLERLQKKYKNDPKKLQQKQQALYEKEGVSLTGGCLPLLVQMVVLFGIIAVIYKPLAYLSDVPQNVVDAAVSAVKEDTYTESDDYTVEGTVATLKDDPSVQIDLTTKLSSQASKSSYYAEMNMMNAMEKNEADIKRAMQAVEGVSAADADKYFEEIAQMKGQFTFSNHSLLENPWRGGFKDISLLWLIPLISGATSVLVSLISQWYAKQGTSREKQPGEGCSNGMMLLFMPLFSLYISFTVPGGVGVYWICSNVISLLQTVVLNIIYNPRKIREQAEIDYEERRRRRAEAKKQNTLADARRRDDEQERLADEAAALAAEEAKNAPKGKKKKTTPMPIELGEVKDTGDKTE